MRKCRNATFDTVLRLHTERIHSRLRSRYWQRPEYYLGTPKLTLHEDLRKWTSENAHSLSTPAERYRTLLLALCDTYEIVDTSADKMTADKHMRRVIRESYDLCTSGGKCSLEQTVERAEMDPNTVCDNANIRQVNSIGHYWGACSALSKFARRYNVFTKVAFEYLPPYQSVYSAVHEVRKPSACYVHAEIQILTFYELNAATNSSSPRVIGSSKAACYLCDLFIKHHGWFLVTNTHGRIHTQWTVPDLKDFTAESVERFRCTLKRMYQGMSRLSVDKETAKWRRYPKESRLDIRLVPSATSISTVRATSPRAMNVEPRPTREHEESVGPEPLAGIEHPESLIDVGKSTTATSAFIQKQNATSGEHSLVSAKSTERTGSDLQVMKDAFAQKRPLLSDKSYSFRSHDGSIQICVEIEGPATGIARFEEMSVDKTIEAVDVLDIRTMEPGSSKQHNRQEGSEEVMLNLLVGTDKMACLRLCWT